jgi:protein involved in polysaccharide export with SLBB domain
VLCAFAGILVSGCLSVAPHLTSLSGAPVPQYLFALSWGDVVEIKSFSHPELNEVQAIRVDGNITIQLLGDLKAAGKTPEQLRQDIVERSDGVLRDPQFAVMVRELKSMRCFVSGEVRTPQAIPLDHPMTVLEAIILAGGPRVETAALDSVVVLRTYRLPAQADEASDSDAQAHGQQVTVQSAGVDRALVRKAYLFNLTDALCGRPGPPIYVSPHDLIFVPQTRIVQLNTWVDQHISKLVPGATYTRTYDGTSVGFDLTPR